MAVVRGQLWTVGLDIEDLKDLTVVFQVSQLIKFPYMRSKNALQFVCNLLIIADVIKDFSS